MLLCDNGSELTGQVLDLWAYHNQVKIDFSRPGKSTDHATGKTISNIRLVQESTTPIGTFDIYFDQIAIVSADSCEKNP